MSLKNRLLKKLSGDDTDVLELSTQEKELSGLNLHEVPGAHIGMEKKAENHIARNPH